LLFLSGGFSQINESYAEKTSKLYFLMLSSYAQYKLKWKRGFWRRVGMD
jgi:hypothetical protein